MGVRFTFLSALYAMPGLLTPSAAAPLQNGTDVAVDWQTVLIASKTYATLQEVSNPLLLGNSSILPNTMESLSLVASDYARFVPWFPYPKLSVPELRPPVNDNSTCTTFWDFTIMDQILGDFMEVHEGKKTIINYSTTPDWMWIHEAPEYSYPDSLTETAFGYNRGSELRDPSMKEVTDYYQRIINWYVNGGFTDECGVYHESGHHWPIGIWEVLNESEAEHAFTPESYNTIYDAITTAILEVAPDMIFVGGALAYRKTEWVEAFMDPAKHADGAPLTWFSYHFYPDPMINGTTEEEANFSFGKADELFLQMDEYNAIRDRLSPETKINMNEVGTWDAQAKETYVPGYVVPDEYWAWGGGVFAYVYSTAITKGIDVVGESQLVGSPGQFESVSMIDYQTGLPNARLRVLQLMQQEFAPGDLVLQTTVLNKDQIHAQAFETASGTRKILIINKKNETIKINVDGIESGMARIVDVSTQGGDQRAEQVSGLVTVTPYATMVITWA